MLEEEEQKRQKRCPNCESRHIRYDEDREVWVCSDCDYEWTGENNKVSEFNKGMKE